jgi:hypothetical protein
VNILVGKWLHSDRCNQICAWVLEYHNNPLTWRWGNSRRKWHCPWFILEAAIDSLWMYYALSTFVVVIFKMVLPLQFVLVYIFWGWKNETRSSLTVDIFLEWEIAISPGKIAHHHPVSARLLHNQKKMVEVATSPEQKAVAISPGKLQYHQKTPIPPPKISQIAASRPKMHTNCCHNHINWLYPSKILCTLPDYHLPAIHLRCRGMAVVGILVGRRGNGIVLVVDHLSLTAVDNGTTRLASSTKPMKLTARQWRIQKLNRYLPISSDWKEITSNAKFTLVGRRHAVSCQTRTF